MSIHAPLSAEAQERLAQQKKKSTLISFLVSIAVIAALGGILQALFILIPEKKIETIISYQVPPAEKETTKDVTIQKQTRQTPTPPAASSAVANVITTTAPTAVSVPDTNQMVSVDAPDFGSSDDFGMGFGFGDASSSATTFFGSSVTGNRIAYVIDYSLSMKGTRDTLMREELTQSVENLEGGADFSLIFFAGPVWLASDTIKFKPDGRSIAITTSTDGQKVDWQGMPGGMHGRNVDPKLYKDCIPKWIKPSSDNIKSALKDIKSNPLALGTDWEKPLRKALELDPLPDVIVFMTDGNGGSLDLAKKLAKQAKKKSIVINSVALLEPKAKDAMKILAEETGGTAIMVKSENEIEDLFTGEVSQR